MVDRSLNYGRAEIGRFLAAAAQPRSILDLGAGGGDDLALAAARWPAAELLAVEAHPAARAALEARGYRVLRLDVERDALPLGDCAVDVVIANQILEHVKEVFWILHQVSRVLRVGGSLILGVPNLASLHNRLLLAAGRQPTANRNSSAHVRAFTLGDLLALLACFPGGYELVARRGSNFYPFPPQLARPLAALLPGLAVGMFLDLRKVRPYGREFLEHPARERLQTNFYLG